MGYYNIIMPAESAWEIINLLGELGSVEFADLLSDEFLLNRPFISNIKRCEEML